ncbi:hypothetical protein X797_011425 [Metarhizium robertsii]|uniref:Uncharacterized protein n=1 Tax=Metarhizium robertsii TaxID=568076 RepID=A0A0A1UMI7_9HYPO|nr:hypothetical protein X797_011425 [Metarhizium robertsii]
MAGASMCRPIIVGTVINMRAKFVTLRKTKNCHTWLMLCGADSHIDRIASQSLGKGENDEYVGYSGFMRLFWGYC